jgi:hypothetical protein
MRLSNPPFSPRILMASRPETARILDVAGMNAALRLP